MSIKNEHYNQLPIQALQLTCHLHFAQGNAIKYLWRAGFKGDEVEDLLKAYDYAFVDNSMDHDTFYGLDFCIWELENLDLSENMQMALTFLKEIQQYGHVKSLEDLKELIEKKIKEKKLPPVDFHERGEEMKRAAGLL